VLLLVISFTFFAISFLWFFRATQFYKNTSTCCLMLIEPSVCGLWLSIHRSFNISIKRRPCLTGAITSPHMLSVKIYLVLKIVIDCDIQTSLNINWWHYTFKLFSVPSFSNTSPWIGKE
jgi:hypothetical protein